MQDQIESPSPAEIRARAIQIRMEREAQSRDDQQCEHWTYQPAIDLEPRVAKSQQGCHRSRIVRSLTGTRITLNTLDRAVRLNDDWQFRRALIVAAELAGARHNLWLRSDSQVERLPPNGAAVPIPTDRSRLLQGVLGLTAAAWRIDVTKKVNDHWQSTWREYLWLRHWSEKVDLDLECFVTAMQRRLALRMAIMQSRVLESAWRIAMATPRLPDDVLASLRKLEGRVDNPHEKKAYFA